MLLVVTLEYNRIVFQYPYILKKINLIATKMIWKTPLVKFWWHTLLFVIAAECAPKSSLPHAVLYAGFPSTGKYSWFKVRSFAMVDSTDLTTGSTHGLPSSSLYAVNQHIMHLFVSVLKIKILNPETVRDIAKRTNIWDHMHWQWSYIRTFLKIQNFRNFNKKVKKTP